MDGRLVSLQLALTSDLHEPKACNSSPGQQHLNPLYTPYTANGALAGQIPPSLPPPHPPPYGQGVSEQSHIYSYIGHQPGLPPLGSHERLGQDYHSHGTQPDLYSHSGSARPEDAPWWSQSRPGYAPHYPPPPTHHGHADTQQHDTYHSWNHPDEDRRASQPQMVDDYQHAAQWPHLNSQDQPHLERHEGAGHRSYSGPAALQQVEQSLPGGHTYRSYYAPNDPYYSTDVHGAQNQHHQQDVEDHGEYPHTATSSSSWPSYEGYYPSQPNFKAQIYDSPVAGTITVTPPNGLAANRTDSSESLDVKPDIAAYQPVLQDQQYREQEYGDTQQVSAEHLQQHSEGQNGTSIQSAPIKDEMANQAGDNASYYPDVQDRTQYMQLRIPEHKRKFSQTQSL